MGEYHTHDGQGSSEDSGVYTSARLGPEHDEVFFDPEQDPESEVEIAPLIHKFAWESEVTGLHEYLFSNHGPAHIVDEEDRNKLSDLNLPTTSVNKENDNMSTVEVDSCHLWSESEYNTPIRTLKKSSSSNSNHTGMNQPKQM